MAYFIETNIAEEQILTYNFKTRPCSVKLSTQLNATRCPSLSLIPSETKARV